MSTYFIAGDRETEARAFLDTSDCLLIGMHHMCVKPCSPLQAKRSLERCASKNPLEMDGCQT